MLKKVAFVTCLFMSIGFASTKELLIVNGIPEKSIISSKDTTINVKVLSKKAEQAKCIIILNSEGEYIWSSRNNTEMTFQRSGIYDMFIAKNGAGIVKVKTMMFDSLEVPYTYMEIMHLGLSTVTYFGTCKYLLKK